MKKGIFYFFFLIILPVSFGSSENTGCSGIKQSENQEQVDKSSQYNNFSEKETSVNSKK